jgi:hypothetical protein
MSRTIKRRSTRSISIAVTAAVAALAGAAYATLPAQGATTAQAPAAISTRAYAYVSHGGSVSHASGLTQANVVTAGASSYCFKGLGFTPNNLQITLGALDNAGTNATIDYAALGTGGAFSGCPAGTQAYVVTITSTSAAPNGFFVLFH